MNERYRVPRFGKPYRDPFCDDLQIILDQIEHEATTITSLAADADQVRRALIADAYREPCFICDEKPDCVGIFVIPAELRKFRQSHILYTLCNPCRLDITTRAKVVDRLCQQVRDENERMGVQ